MVANKGEKPVLGTFSEPKEVLEYIRRTGVEMVDLRFVDLIGTVQHFTIPSAEFNQSMFDWGTGFDGSS
ncbi:MAG: glutamine synthetase, partial [Chloroflexi bacterium]|nr:glutamine synthetase [Chloroflexota bacterium]